MRGIVTIGMVAPEDRDFVWFTVQPRDSQGQSGCSGNGPRMRERLIHAPLWGLVSGAGPRNAFGMKVNKIDSSVTLRPLQQGRHWRLF